MLQAPIYWSAQCLEGFLRAQKFQLEAFEMQSAIVRRAQAQATAVVRDLWDQWIAHWGGGVPMDVFLARLKRDEDSLGRVVNWYVREAMITRMRCLTSYLLAMKSFASASSSSSLADGFESRKSSTGSTMPLPLR